MSLGYTIVVMTLFPLTSADFTREMVCGMTLYPSGNLIAWECPEQMAYMICHGLYSPRQMLATRIQMFKEIAFIAFPRLRCGVAATLMTMNMDDFCRDEPFMYAFPNWDMNNATGLWSMSSVVDIFIDDNSVLWALDTGVVYSLTDTPVVVSTPRLLSFCPGSGKLLSRVNLHELVCGESRLQHIEVEVTEDGETYVYISDAGSGSILVWNVEESTGYKVVLPKDSTDHPLSKDVLYLCLIKRECATPMLYFTYLYGMNMFYIRTCDIRYGKLEGSVNTVGMKPGPMVVLGSDRGQTMYLRMRAAPEVYIWNTGKPFRPRSLILLERVGLPYFSSHIVAGFKRLMWTLESNFNDYMNNSHDSIGPRIRVRPLIRFCDSTP